MINIPQNIMTCFLPQVVRIESSMVQTTRGSRKREFTDQRDLEIWASYRESPLESFTGLFRLLTLYFLIPFAIICYCGFWNYWISFKFSCQE